MVSTQGLARYLSKVLFIRSIPDASRNGLQVKSSPVVKKIGAAVDCTERTILAAEREGVDFLIVHHGLFWKGKRDATGLRMRAMQLLKKRGISLYAAHLPLDLHPRLGNNIALAEMLGLTSVEPFGNYHGIKIGFKGKFPRPVEPLKLKRMIDRGLTTSCIMHAYGRKRIHSIGVISGGAFPEIADAIRHRLDCYLTGEGPHYAGDVAKEASIHLVLGGHYETEMFGVQRLSAHAATQYELPYTFLYVPPL